MNKIKRIKNTWWQKVIFVILLFFPLANWIFFINYGYFLISAVPGETNDWWVWILGFFHWPILFGGSLIWIFMIGEWFCIGFKKDIIDEFIENQEND